ncbi:SIMPL domain-containing protein [Mycetocola tolaasinivorans]|uniref:SIMPL domain-containing protein n=1 Tax=Mycetocola tolaasinivorans TaxID=76635 RepID=A0A3L7A951_9MICO|nr:SIMPL domain-containing protein [Mycetocola tolaasinivorans]RLP76378.1 SIMPL domain-containing protein [Mycetocola tolaasinivorans]
MSSVVVVVSGFAQREYPATRAEVSARVEVEGADRREVVERASLLHAELSARAQELSDRGATTRWHADSVSVGTSPFWGPDGVRGADVQRASAGLFLRFSDFAALTEWVTVLASEPLVRLGGVNWDIAEADRGERVAEVRAEAVRDAVSRAEVYAHAAGAGTPALEAIFESGLRPSGGGNGGGGTVFAKGRSFAAASADMAQQDNGFDLTPRPYVVSAEITADFRSN